MMTVQRVEKHKIKPSDKYYAMLDSFCFLSKNLYNHANYILRSELQLNCCKRENFHAFNQVRFIPKQGYIVAEVVYSISICEVKTDNQRYCSIDIGIDNLAAVTTNTEHGAYIINGRGLKSINKHYNKQMAHYREVAKRLNGIDYTKQMGKITDYLT